MHRNHIDAEQLGYLLDEPEGVLPKTRAHLETCDACREELARIQQNEAAFPVEEWNARRGQAIARVQAAIDEFDREREEEQRRIPAINDSTPINQAGSFWGWKDLTAKLANWIGPVPQYVNIALALLALGSGGLAFSQWRAASAAEKAAIESRAALNEVNQKLEGVRGRIIESSEPLGLDSLERIWPDDSGDRIIELENLIAEQAEAIAAHRAKDDQDKLSLQKELEELRSQNRALEEKNKQNSQQSPSVPPSPTAAPMQMLSFVANQPRWLTRIDYPDRDHVRFVIQLEPREIYTSQGSSLIAENGNRSVLFSDTVEPQRGIPGGTVALTMSIRDLTPGKYRLVARVTTRGVWPAPDKRWGFRIAGSGQ